MIDFPQAGSSAAYIATYRTASAAGAQRSVADDPRGIHAEVVGVGADAHRHDANLASLHALESDTSEVV